FHHGTAEHDTPAAIMQAVNDDFRSIFGTRSFMTAMCLALEPEIGRAAIVGAGHPPLLISRHSGEVELIASGVPPLGLIERPQFTETVISVGLNDTFLLYTDGLFGSPDSKNRRLTPEMVGKLMEPNAPTAEVFLAKILDQIAPGDAKSRLPDDVAAV